MASKLSMPESVSVTCRKIDNGYLVSHSISGPTDHQADS